MATTFSSCLIELRFYIPLDTIVISEMFFPANLLASTEKTGKQK